MEAADAEGRQRLTAQSTQHANSWTLAAPSVSALSSAELPAGLRFALGLSVRTAPYKWPDYRAYATRQVSMPFAANAQGTTRAHTTLRDTVAKLFQEAGYTVTLEAAVTGSLERPADLRVHCWNGRPLAIDFTIVTPTATSAVRGPAAELLLDHAVMAKMRNNCVPCALAGWVCQPFVRDVFGAIRSDARKIISTFINKRLTLSPMERPAEVGKRFWSAVTSAALARAAVQLARLPALDSAGLCPGGVLALRTAREKTAVRLPCPKAQAPDDIAPDTDSGTLQMFVRTLDLDHIPPTP